MSSCPTVPEFLKRHRDMLGIVAELCDAADEFPGSLQRAYNTWAVHYCLSGTDPYPSGEALAEDTRQMISEIDKLLEWMDYAGIDTTDPEEGT